MEAVRISNNVILILAGPLFVHAQEGLFYSTNRWFTQSAGASVEFEFEGTGIWYFADTNDNHGFVRIRVDNDEGEIASGYSPTPVSLPTSS